MHKEIVKSSRPKQQPKANSPSLRKEKQVLENRSKGRTMRQKISIMCIEQLHTKLPAYTLCDKGI